jgi:multiple sugar transport system permease protein
MMQTTQAKPKRSIFTQDNLFMYGMMAPAMIIVFVVSIIPLAYTFYLSFQNYILTKPGAIHFAGFENFTKLFTDSTIRDSILHTFVYTGASVILSLIIGLALAVVINNVTVGKTFFRIALFTPMMLSSVVVGVIWRFLFNNELGVLNYLVVFFGGHKVNWLGTGTMAMTSIIIADIWQWASYTFILALAALEAMNPEPLEAATIDGANSWQIFWSLRFPQMLPVIEVAAVFRFIWAFRSFDLIYALTKGGPGTSTETMALEVWRQAFTRYDVGTSSAVSVLMFCLLFLISIFLLRNSVKNS